MSDKWTAQNTFWNGFGLTAYDAYTVPDDADMPYITYEAMTAGFDEKTAVSASLWYESTSWSAISAKAAEIEDLIGSGMGVEYDGGRLWVTKETPFAQRLNDPSNDRIRRIVLQVAIEFH